MKTDRSLFFFWGVDAAHQLYVRSCGDFSLVPPDREKCKTADFAELFWPVSGQCCFFGNGKQILRPGMVWYYPPGSSQNYYPLSPFRYCWLTVAGEKAGKLFDLLDIKPGINKAGPCPIQLFSVLGHELSEYSRKHKLSALATAFKILLEIGNHSGRNREDSHTMSDIRTRIEADFWDPGLSVNSLAEELNMHRGSFSRAFHKTFDMTVRDYILMVRLKNAIELLSKSDHSIREISEACGFRSANYFSKVFQAKLGMAPGAYRNKRYASQKTDGTGS